MWVSPGTTEERKSYGFQVPMHNILLVQISQTLCYAKNLNETLAFAARKVNKEGNDKVQHVDARIVLQVNADVSIFVEERYQKASLFDKCDKGNNILVFKV
jgi:hypothetical protein